MKNHLDITWSDEATDKKVSGLIAAGMAYLDGKLGGKLDYTQKPSASYSLYSDYYWYEIGDMICIGNSQVLYYCFPTEGKDVVAKTRLAAEELYKLRRGSS